VTTFRRYVAIGDSTTEGLEDPDPQGGYRGWADRLAQHIADAQDEPLEYANLAIRGLRMQQIRTGQLDDALAMQPDLLSIFGGMNDVIAPRCDFDAIRADYVIVFGEACRAGCAVLSFTMPDPAAINPLGWRLRERVNRLNAIIRSEAEPRGVLVMDFDAYPVAKDPRLWFEDRLHSNTVGHIKIAEALAWRLGIPGFDEAWADRLLGEPGPPLPPVPINGDFDWAVHYLLPWLGKRGIRRLPSGLGIERKRPVPTVVPKSHLRVD
jgi:lysophospholipase L1-like esterase